MRIRTLRTFSGVPQGTEGEAEKDGKQFKITWDLPNRSKPLVDWFDEIEFKAFLEII